MRIIHDHKVNGLNEAIQVAAMDEPGSGGANHSYRLMISSADRVRAGIAIHYMLGFQNGPIEAPKDYNGLSNEAVLAVVIDRMRGFQTGPFKCRENAIALTHLEEALMWLQKRTRDRMARGVEGKLEA
jgi:hypothetical protein